MDQKKLIHDLSQTNSQLKMLISILENAPLDKDKLIGHLKKIQNEYDKNLSLILDILKN